MKIHGHPQKTDYRDPTEWPKILIQSHWAPAENPIAPESGQPIMLDLAAGTLGTSTLGHTHLDLDAPLYGELDGPIACRFAVHLFHTTGEAIFAADEQEGARDVVWDATGGATPPRLIGDPAGEKIWTGSLVLDPTLPTRWFTKHGWWSPLLGLRTFYANGDQMSTRLIASFFSMLDPTAAFDPRALPVVSARTTVGSKRHPDDRWGDNIVETNDYLPLAPIDRAWPLWIGTAGYGGQLFNAVFEQRADLDLHHGNAGILLKTITQTGDINTGVTLDPVQLGFGAHKVALLRNQLSSEGNDAVNTLLVMNVNVGTVPDPGTVSVPNVIGQTEAAAIATLGQSHLTVGAITRANNPATAGTVFAQTPALGTLVPAGSAVALQVSLGPTAPPVESWHATPEPIVVEQLGTGPRRRLRVGDRSVELLP
jgi:hypothetical protein